MKPLFFYISIPRMISQVLNGCRASDIPDAEAFEQVLCSERPYIEHLRSGTESDHQPGTAQAFHALQSATSRRRNGIDTPGQSSPRY